MPFFKKTQTAKEFNTIDAYIDEYKIVTNKITSLSLKFSSGSYIIPISMIVGLASVTVDHFIINIILIISPIVLTFYIYNHIRYMALQFKLSGYAKHLEIRINEMLKENVLLWENSVARGNGQNFYEGIFLGITYTAIILLMYYLAYDRLVDMVFMSDISYGVLFVITIIYYFATASLIFFLLFFTNEHDASFARANRAFNATSTVKKSNSIFVSLKKIVAKLIIVIAVLTLFPISVLPLVLLSPNTINAVENYDYVVVLGNKSKNDVPSCDMQSRLNCLISYIDEQSNIVVVLSGGKGEATLMKNYLIDRGLTNLQIITEEDSVNTYENFINVKQIVPNNSLVITSDYHIFRSNLICSRLGSNFDFLAAKSDNVILFKAIKECYAAYFDLLRVS